MKDNIIDEKVSLGNNILGYRYTEIEAIEEDEEGNPIRGREHGKDRLEQALANNVNEPPKIKLVNKYTFELINNIVSSNPGEEI